MFSSFLSNSSYFSIFINVQAGGGSGFGLLISKRIIKLHHGKLYVESAGEGLGSTFVVELNVPLRVNLYIKSKSLRGPSSFYKDMEAGYVSVATDEAPTDPITSAADLNRQGDQHEISISKYFVPIAPDGQRAIEMSGGGGGGGAIGRRNIDLKRSSVVRDKRLFQRENVGLKDEDRRSEAKTDANDEVTNVSKKHTTKVSLSQTQPHTKGIIEVATGSHDQSHTIVTEKTIPSYHVLLVDDSPINRKMLGKALKSAGHTFDSAENGQIAYEGVSGQLNSGHVEYDVVLMDFVMPVMDGPTATKALRQAGVRVPILGVTGNGMQYDVDWFLECGATAVLLKPFNIDEFHRIMSSKSC